MERDAVEQERLVPDRAEYGVQGGQQAWIGPPVHVEGVAVGVWRVVPGGQVGEDVRAAKAVDGLFGIADQEHRLAGVGVDIAENRVLHRVGVLKFVDQGGGVAVAQGFHQRRALSGMA